MLFLHGPSGSKPDIGQRGASQGFVLTVLGYISTAIFAYLMTVISLTYALPMDRVVRK